MTSTKSSKEVLINDVNNIKEEIIDEYKKLNDLCDEVLKKKKKKQRILTKDTDQ